MALSYTVVSIGALSRNRFWNELAPKRAAHATTTLIRDGNKTILVDPGLPEAVLAQRLDERTGLTPEQIDIVFLTNFRPAHRRGIGLFPRATWFMHELEMAAIREHLDNLAASIRDAGADADTDDDDGLGSVGELWADDELKSDAKPADSDSHSQAREVESLIHQERVLLDRMKAAPEKLTRQVHLYPSIGSTPGSAGLLVTEANRTLIVAGDAVVTRDYFEAGRVFEQVYDVEAAQESLRDVIEIADLIIPAHDNLFVVSGR